MALEFYWEPSIPYIITTAPWTFTYIALIIWAKNAKRQVTLTEHINFLQIVGILILAWNAIYFFLPSVRLSFSPWPTEFDFLIINLINFTYYLIPNILFMLLGIALLLYVKENYAFKNRNVAIGPALYLAGSATLLLLHLSSFLLFQFLNPIYDAIYEIFIYTEPIARFLQIAGACLLLLFSIRLNRDFFIFFTSLLLASIFVAFLFEINYVSWYIHYWL